MLMNFVYLNFVQILSTHKDIDSLSKSKAQFRENFRKTEEKLLKKI